MRRGCVGCGALVLVSSECSRERFGLRLDVPRGAGLELALASGLKLRVRGFGGLVCMGAVMSAGLCFVRALRIWYLSSWTLDALHST